MTLSKHRQISILLALLLGGWCSAINTDKLEAFGVTPWSKKWEVELRLWKEGFNFRSKSSLSRSVTITVYGGAQGRVVFYHTKSKCLLLETPLIEVNGNAIQAGDTRANVIKKLGNPDRTGARAGAEFFVYEDLNRNGALNVKLVAGRVVHFSFPFHP